MDYAAPYQKDCRESHLSFYARILNHTQRIIRDYCRNRLFYTWQLNRIRNRLLKILESNNIKLRFVISSIHTLSAMDMIRLLAGIAPGNNESAGKRKNTSIKKGNSYLRVAIVGAAWAAVRMKDSYWHALFDKLRKRMKAQKAIEAVARRLFKVVYKTLETLTIYQEKGIAHFVDLQAKAALYHAARL